MRRAVARFWLYSPAALAFALLAIQMYIPFSVANFATADGPSYVYNAQVARDLVFHRDSLYASVYQFRHAAVPNWGGLVLVNVILTFVPVEHAERVLLAVTLLIGFLCVSFLIRTVAPGASAWTPLANVVMQNTLLWSGFYDFCLSAAAALLLVAYYIRRPGPMTAGRFITLTAGLAGVFLIHLMGAAVAMLAVGLLAMWRWFVEPKRPEVRTAWKQVLLVGASMLPAVGLAAAFAAASLKPVEYFTSPVAAIVRLPISLFNTAGDFLGIQTVLCLGILAAGLFSMIRLHREGWKSPGGGIAALVIGNSLAYVIVPDGGFGGGRAKVRFVWALFIFAIALVRAAPPLPRFQIIFAWATAILLAINLSATERVVSACSRAIGDYLAAVGSIPPGSRILRVYYPAPDIEQRYGFPGLAQKPLLRVDSLIAARCHCLDWTDYQALAYIFPVILRPGIPPDQQDRFWHDLEAPGRGTDEARWLYNDAFGRIDYVIVMADRLSGIKQANFPVMIANLNDLGMELTSQSRNATFIRVYARPDAGADKDNDIRVVPKVRVSR